jgi:hypothetical protein
MNDDERHHYPRECAHGDSAEANKLQRAQHGMY